MQYSKNNSILHINNTLSHPLLWDWTYRLLTCVHHLTHALSSPSLFPSERGRAGGRKGERNKEWEAKIPFREEENNRREEGRRKRERGREERDRYRCIREEVTCLDIWVCSVCIRCFNFCEVILFFFEFMPVFYFLDLFILVTWFRDIK